MIFTESYLWVLKSYNTLTLAYNNTQDYSTVMQFGVDCVSSLRDMTCQSSAEIRPENDLSKRDYRVNFNKVYLEI